MTITAEQMRAILDNYPGAETFEIFDWQTDQDVAGRCSVSVDGDLTVVALEPHPDPTARVITHRGRVVDSWQVVA